MKQSKKEVDDKQGAASRENLKKRRDTEEKIEQNGTMREDMSG